MARAVLYGIGVSTGIAIGNSFVLGSPKVKVRHELIPLPEVESETSRLQEAVDKVALDFEKARNCLPDDLGLHAEMIDSYLLICKDPNLAGEALRRIREQRMNAEWALEESVACLAEAFSRLPSLYIRDRFEDVRIISDRIAQALNGNTPTVVIGEEKDILLAYDLSPADVVGLSTGHMESFVTECGGKTSHTGILARSLHIPAIVGAVGLCRQMRPGELLIVDAFRSKVLLGPSEIEVEEYLALREEHEQYQKRIHVLSSYPAESEDGQRVTVLANIESAREVENVIRAGGEGVGLVRTEFGYMARSAIPAEAELAEEYMRLARRMHPRKVTFRTLDVGAGKSIVGRKTLDEPNPALGLRAIRYCLRHQDILRTQLRAILRASAFGNVALMFPLISGLSELRQAKSILNEAMQELDAVNIPFDKNLPVGIMVELPSAVFMADILAREVDFFSIGSNDLVQYSLGVDRDNSHVSYLHQPLHPAIIRAIKQVVDMAHKSGISVCVCGEMAADPYCLPILLGMQVDELSLAPQSIPAVKHLVRRSAGRECRELLDYALGASTARSIIDMLRQTIFSRFPEDVAFFISQQDGNL